MVINDLLNEMILQVMIGNELLGSGKVSESPYFMGVPPGS